MLEGRLLSILLLVSFSSSVAHAQLGPKDGANLKPTDIERIKVGDRAPDFTLENIDGKKINLSDFRGRKNVVLVFYRGHW
jgi:cytochrome oxidase Cu insertion factor (SCO1/SenC/PrrC family)